MDSFNFTKEDCLIVKQRMQKRLKYREEFLKARTDPCQHAGEAGHVFDPAIQRFLSMKAKSFDTYQFTFMNGLKSFLIMALPMFAYGTLVYYTRAEKEAKIRSGEIKYRERAFKFQ